MCGMTLATEIGRSLGKGACHDIPGGASAADVIDGRECTREIVRLTVGRRRGGGEADTRGTRGECRQQGQRLEADHDRRMYGGSGVERIREKEQVEFAALRRLRNPQQQWEILGSRLRLRQAPAGHMMPGAHDVDTEMHLTGRLSHRAAPFEKRKGTYNDNIAQATAVYFRMHRSNRAAGRGRSSLTSHDRLAIFDPWVNRLDRDIDERLD